METKICKECNTTKEISLFSKGSKNYTNTCKKCYNKKRCEQYNLLMETKRKVPKEPPLVVTEKKCIDCNTIKLLEQYPKGKGKVCTSCTNNRKTNKRRIISAKLREEEENKNIEEKTTKICIHCKNEFSKEKFTLSKGKFTNVCKQCYNKQRRINFAKKHKKEIISHLICFKCNQSILIEKCCYFDKNPVRICLECYSNADGRICMNCFKSKSIENFPIRKKEYHKVCKDCHKEHYDNKVKPETKTCATCEETFPFDNFIGGGLYCNNCYKIKHSEMRKNKTISKYKSNEKKQCRKCNETKFVYEFPTYCNFCQQCKAKSSYELNPLRQQAKRQWIKDNRGRVNIGKLKNYHSNYKHDIKFRFISNQRKRVYAVLRNKKTKSTEEYLNCNRDEFIIWMQFNKEEYKFQNFTLENYGSVWNVDHVIPLNKFDMTVEKNKYIAFNWRNTMPMRKEENSGKRDKILLHQVQQHYETLKKFHEENKIELPSEYHELYARHLLAGTS